MTVGVTKDVKKDEEVQMEVSPTLELTGRWTIHVDAAESLSGTWEYSKASFSVPTEEVTRGHIWNYVGDRVHRPSRPHQSKWDYDQSSRVSSDLLLLSIAGHF